MYLPTDYQLQINVIYYDINSARIFFTDGFWTSYSDQLIKDYRRETGLVLNDRKKFLAKIKRALFTYYYMKLVQNKKTQDLYSAVISIFHDFSRNNLPIKVTSLDNVPIYYEDEWKLEDPTDIKLDEQDDTPSTVTTVSMSDILLAHESVSRREYDINKEHEDLADTFLQQFFNEKTNLERLQQDYEKGALQHLFHQIGSVGLKENIDNVFKLVELIYDYYHGSIGMVTIFNSISLYGLELSTTIRSERRFDLWMKTYNNYHVFRALVNYIGADVCEFLYSSFLRNIEFNYFNGYHYVFNSFIVHDFIKRSYLKTSPFVPPHFIDLNLDRQKEKNTTVFGSFRNSKTGHFQSMDAGFGTTNKNIEIFSGKGLTNSDRPVKPISKATLGFGSKNSSAFSFISKGNKSDSD